MGEVKHRSVSQLNQYLKCPYAYYLERVLGAWQRPAAWLPQGSAFHEAIETWERSGRLLSRDETKQVYADVYTREIGRYAAETPNFDYWFASGPYKGWVASEKNGKSYAPDVERRFAKGMEQVDRYIDYYTTAAPNEVVWLTPEGEPGIELEFNIDLDGVPVKGFIDGVLQDGVSTPFPRDAKSGKLPGDAVQLVIYALALSMMFGIPITVGDYWMGERGKPTVPYDLTAWTRDEVTAEFHKLDEGIRAGRFDPDPDPDKCRMCAVNSACEFRASFNMV